MPHAVALGDEEISDDCGTNEEDDLSSADEAAILAREPIPLDQLVKRSQQGGPSEDDVSADLSNGSANLGCSAESPVVPSAGPGIAALVGHLRCDNLKLREELAEMQQLLESERRMREMGQCEEGKENLTEVRCEDKLELERELIRCKLKCADAVDRVEALEALKEHYEGQLASMDPSFRPVSLAEFERNHVGRVVSQESNSTMNSVVEQTSVKGDSGRKNRRSITKLMGRMFKHQAPRAATATAADLNGFSATREDLATQREVISCLMSELEKANRKAHRLRAKIAKQGMRDQCHQDQDSTHHST